MQKHRFFAIALCLISAVSVLTAAPVRARADEPSVKPTAAIEKAPEETSAQPATATHGSPDQDAEHGDHADQHGAGAASTHGTSILAEFWYNFRHNLFKPLLLFFYMGFLFPILKVKFDFPYVIYQGLTIYLLIAIGWKGGEELAELPAKTLTNAMGFMGVGFVLNFLIGILAFLGLSAFTRLRRIDKATVAGYYGSDSAGTFVTCLGVLVTANIKYE